MTVGGASSSGLPDGFVDGAARVILGHQDRNGAIPWHDDGVFDPWNHVEAAMGLGIAGHHDAALKAFRYLANRQEPDGSWWGTYHGDASGKKIRDTNFCAYVATGIWHAFLLRREPAGLAEFWPVIDKALSFVLSLQGPDGEIRWAAPDPLTPENDALIAGCSSIYKSLECALLAARALGHSRPAWSDARRKLGIALREKPERFDRQWESKSHFSMSWYYPVLGGVLRGEAARAHLQTRWHEFVVEGHGCRCVQDQPWVTVAEGAELAIALAASGQFERARAVFAWQHQWRDRDGGYWMGHQIEQGVFWPAVKPAWTAAAMLLAADTLTNATPAARLFIDVGLSDAT